mgnify:CR=1 FL=1
MIKKRPLGIPTIVDRIVQQWYVYEFIKPYVMKRFIFDTYACLDNKGTHFAVRKVKNYMQLMKRQYNSYYVLKCDVKSFFNSIDKNILYDNIKKTNFIYKFM